jgi:hypothetical protein
MLVILFAFAALVLAMLMMFSSFSLGGGEEEVPAIFKITSITHGTNYDSIVVLLHTGSVTYTNSNLMAKFYKNEQLFHCDILTLNGHDFINTIHHGVQTIGGGGCSEKTWLPGERLTINFNDKTFHPGDLVRAEIYDATSGLIISRHSFRA